MNTVSSESPSRLASSPPSNGRSALSHKLKSTPTRNGVMKYQDSGAPDLVSRARMPAPIVRYSALPSSVIRPYSHQT